MEICKPISTPLETGLKLIKEPNPQFEEEKDNPSKFPYKEAVGSLVFAMTCTSPDIAYAVMSVSQHLTNPGQRIFRYLKDTQNLGILYKRDQGLHKLKLVGYSDANWVLNVNDRRSTLGYIFMLAGGAVSWASKK